MASKLLGEKSKDDADMSKTSFESIELGTVEEKSCKEVNDGEIFQDTENGVQFRTLGWVRASVVFMKIQFALGVLGIPVAFDSLGAVGGALSIIGWGALNHWGSIIQGEFRNRHTGCHSCADMAGVVGGKYLKELAGALFVLGYILCAGSGIVGLSTGLNALSHHATCTVWFSLLSAVVISSFASFRRLEEISYVTWAGFVSIFSAVLILVIAVTTRDRPAAAPPAPEPFDLGLKLIVYPDFIPGITATATIFLASAGSSAFIPILSEMKNPKDYKKALVVCNSFINSTYLSFSWVVYYWCGKWVASPSLGSAGSTIKMISYGVALVGLLASGVIYLHTAAKYLFVRILRNSPHLQNGSWVHWSIWLGLTFGMATLSFLLAESIPIFNYILSLTGSICFAPLALVLPGWLWLHDFSDQKKKGIKGILAFVFHWFMILLGVFLCVGGTYATVVSIIDAYASGKIASSFSCADNSGSV